MLLCLMSDSALHPSWHSWLELLLLLQDTIYRCRTCRRLLASSFSIMPLNQDGTFCAALLEANEHMHTQLGCMSMLSLLISE